MKWLRNQPSSKFQIHDTKESGYWICVESRAKLNTPGKSDGVNQLWIDGRLEYEQNKLNFRGSYTQYGINSVFLEAYWNEGATKTESRWYDNFIISTKPIGPVVCSTNPTIKKTPYWGNDKAGKWQFEIASDFNGNNIVFKSKLLSPSSLFSVINCQNGQFTGDIEDRQKLQSGKIYFLRVRQRNKNGVFSDWSRWHQSFRTQS